MDKVTSRVHKPQPFRRERRAEVVPNLTPYRKAKSALKLDDDELMLNVLRCQLTY